MQQSVFISGAAQGIGAEIARLFHNHGYKVGIYDINEVQAHLWPKNWAKMPKRAI